MCPPMEWPGQGHPLPAERLHHAPARSEAERVRWRSPRRRPRALAVTALIEGQQVVAPEEGGDHRVEPVGMGGAAVGSRARGTPRRRPSRARSAGGRSPRRICVPPRRIQSAKAEASGGAVVMPGILYRRARVTFLSRRSTAFVSLAPHPRLRAFRDGQDGIAGFVGMAAVARMLLFRQGREDYP